MTPQNLDMISYQSQFLKRFLKFLPLELQNTVIVIGKQELAFPAYMLPVYDTYFPGGLESREIKRQILIISHTQFVV